MKAYLDIVNKILTEGIRKENRTGVSKASAGLNAEALQSTTSAAVTATMSGAQGRVELICRHFAEGGLKEMFRTTNNLVIKHQNAQDVFRLNGKFIPVDPRYWDTDKDLVVNVAISKSSDTTGSSTSVTIDPSVTQSEVVEVDSRGSSRTYMTDDAASQRP